MLAELSPAEITETLAANDLGRIGCRQGDRIFIFPVNYIFRHDMAYCQSYEATKIAMMREQPDICFEVEDIRGFSHWKTVMGWGIFEELTDSADISDAQQQFSEVMLARKAALTSLPPTEPHRVESGRPGIIYYRIRFNELSGRMEKGI